jgi:nitroreductase
MIRVEIREGVTMLEVIKTRRSIRSFKQEPVPDEDAMQILDAARLAPSGGNRQRWKFVYVKAPHVVRMIKNCSPGIYGDAAAVIAICLEVEKEAFGRTEYSDAVGIMDVGFAAENILLAAKALGLGGCAIASFNASGVKKVLEIPDGWKPVLLVTLGYPDKEPRVPTKKTLSEVVYLNRFGEKWDGLEGRR